MENQFQKLSGICLITGPLLAILTMVLHPSGGSIEHILKIKYVIMYSHSLAIVSLPFLGFGFYGLSVFLLIESNISIFALIISALGIIAALMAGTINGLTIPLYLSNLNGKQPAVVIESIVNYGLMINRPLAYIFIIASSLAILIWSTLIILYSRLPRWIGYYGVFFILLAFLEILLRFDFASLFGFRLFLFAIVSWMIFTGYLMTTRAIKNRFITSSPA